MNEENENLENLEKELSELKKQKLHKQIKDLEKDLGLSAETEVVEQKNPVITKKSSNFNFIPVLIIGIAAVVVMFNQDDFNLIERLNPPPPLPTPEFLDVTYIKNGSQEYTFNNKTGCIPILHFDFEEHPVLGKPGKTTFEVTIPNFDSKFTHATGSYEASVVLITSSNFVQGDNLYTDQNFAGQKDLINNIKISKAGSTKTFKINPSVPLVIFDMEKVNNQVCDYRVNK